MLFKVPKLFKTPTHRQFEFTTRYYNPEKEELQARLERAKYEAEADRNSPDYEAGKSIRGAMRQQSRLQRRGADFSQLIFIVGFGGVMAAYWFYGYWALLSLVALVWVYIKLKQR
jgi:hypothetical protein